MFTDLVFDVYHCALIYLRKNLVNTARSSLVSGQMAGISRPASELANKKHSMRPPISRPLVPVRAQSSAPSLHPRAQSGAGSPDESTLSISTNTSHSRSPKKRKERDFDTDGGQETNIHVVVRCRGRNDREVRENSGVVVSTDGVKGKNVELSMGASALSNKTYHFDKVFSPAADQSMIYDDVVTPILEEVRVAIAVQFLNLTW